MAERTRQRLTKRPGFNVYDAFDACDSDADGKISTSEIQRLIESRGFYVSYKDVQGLVDKFDKDRDGRISLGEVSIPKNSDDELTVIPI
jgi:Ca2+-binding EF-hand superfamily protein